jgi:hypothetical protein
MSLSSCKMLLPKKKWFGPEVSKTGKVIIPEDCLQRYANESIFLRKWVFIRFPNALLGWIKNNPNVPEWVKCVFFGQVGGKLPDNLIMIPVAPGCFFSVKLELKTQDANGAVVGKLRGKQKTYGEAERWFIARSPEQIEEILNKISVMSEKVRKCLTSIS